MSVPAQKSSVMAAISGRQIDLSDFCAQDVCLLDVAHALSLQCRAGGHFERFYSVAQHCLNCEAEARAQGLGARVRLACLLHDAGEAYLSDLIRPVKALLPDYARLEKRIDQAVFTAFGLDGLTAEEWEQVHAIDDAMLYYEFLALRQDVVLFDTAPEVCRLPDTDEQPSALVRQSFAQLCERLLRQAGVAADKIDRVTRGKGCVSTLSGLSGEETGLTAMQGEDGAGRLRVPECKEEIWDENAHYRTFWH